jgi:BCD family chlorophyll transporter-like MFS transporter
MVTALIVGTLNRVMIVELGVAAWLVALMVALPLLVAPLRAFTGFRSDTHRSAFGWRRVPFIWTGTMLQFFGLAIMPFALLVLSGKGAVPVPAWFGSAAAAFAFLVVGLGLQTAQTTGLALATDLADDATRPRVVALMYVMLLVGMVGSSFAFSLLLAEFSPQRLVQVVQAAALVVLGLNGVALWKQEARDPARAARLSHPVSDGLQGARAQRPQGQGAAADRRRDRRGPRRRLHRA